MSKENKVIYLKDYQPLDWAIHSVDISFELEAKQTIVTSKLHMILQGDKTKPVILHGQDLTTLSLKVDNQDIDINRLEIIEDQISLDAPNKDSFIIETKVMINPKENTRLSGLYASKTMLCTQCEAEGFRRITWFTDRPDNLAIWNVKLIADKSQYPVLLSNGNHKEAGELKDKKHYVCWADPHPKPSYLFALVAGDLGLLHDEFTTMEGNKVDLNIWVLKGNEKRAEWSMKCLKNAMAWDEKTYGRAYDLEQFNIVSVPDFNMGAMENKSLNIFNDALFLAEQSSATDKDFERIDTVIAHEYFHNWTGNRITCRDWFQLSLKEGLTVYRDQQYTAETYTASTARMDEVSLMRNIQFKEDAGPLSHPVRPDSFVDISNFYTVTIYDKGAEVIRMLHHLLGDEQYYKGMALYFERHDGQAVTVEDFIKSFEDANDVDLSQFFLWYTQAGTPTVEMKYNFENKDDLVVEFTQKLVEQEGKKPQIIPIKFAVFCEEDDRIIIEEQVLILDDWQKSFVFKDIPKGIEVIPSWNRDFSAPIKMVDERDTIDFSNLVRHDKSGFNRADAFFNLAVEVILDTVYMKESEAGNIRPDSPLYRLGTSFGDLDIALKFALTDRQISDGDLASLMVIPTESYINQQLEFMKPQIVHEARKEVICGLSDTEGLKERFFKAIKDDDNQLTPSSMATRRLINICLSYLAKTDDADILAYMKEQLISGQNMTLRAAALSYASLYHNESLKDAIAHFEKEFRNEPLVMDKYFAAQAAIVTPNAVEHIEKLMKHSAFSLKNPNRLRAVLGTFAATIANLHASDGSGYKLMEKYLKQLDCLNPEIASRMAQPLAVVHLFEGEQKEMLIQSLKSIKSDAQSKTLIETLDRALA
ncbi:MAG: aminopeptidase N [Alphaproteobacteria bacterium]